jgi:hypothetical protein
MAAQASALSLRPPYRSEPAPQAEAPSLGVERWVRRWARRYASRIARGGGDASPIHLIRGDRFDYARRSAVQMGKVLLLSFIFATIALPVRASRGKDPEKGLKTTIRWMVAFNLFYLVNLYYLQARMG